MVGDPIADFITRIQNASMARLPSIVVPFSNLKNEIAEKLLSEGFVSNVEKKGKKIKRYLEVTLKYSNDEPEVRGVRRVSKLGKRVYLKVNEIKPVKFGHGIMVISTPKGILTDKEAIKENVGGEPLFAIW
jgi:small subunit ribosomal protein S8